MSENEKKFINFAKHFSDNSELGWNIEANNEAPEEKL